MAVLPPPTVRSVLELPALGLVLRAGSVRTAEGAERPISWVAVSELEDPRAFLEGGELLLSTGMRLDADDGTALEEYVQRLVDAQVSAFGLGVGLSHPTVPAGLVAAAERHGLVVVEVPEPTPFIAVTKAISSMVAAQEYEQTTRAFETQRDLTRAALGAHPLPSVAARLARSLSAWVVVLDRAGQPLAASPGTAGTRAAGLRGELDRLRDKRLLASAALDVEGDRVVLHPLGAHGAVRGFLAVGRAEPFDRTDTALVAVAVSLLSLAVERAGPDGSAEERLQQATLRLLLAGADPDRLPLEALGWGWLRHATFRVVRVAGARDLSVLPAGPETVVLAEDADLVALVTDEAAAGLGESVRVAGLRAGGSGPVTLATAAAGYAAAGSLMRAGGGPGVWWQDRLGGQGLLDLLDPDAAREFADAVLAPLEAARGGPDLVSSLAAFLAHNGQWDVAATAVGVHRHTLRHRMRRVEELLGRPLDDAGLRAELWYALAARG